MSMVSRESWLSSGKRPVSSVVRPRVSNQSPPLKTHHPSLSTDLAASKARIDSLTASKAAAEASAVAAVISASTSAAASVSALVSSAELEGLRSALLESQAEAMRQRVRTQDAENRMKYMEARVEAMERERDEAREAAAASAAQAASAQAEVKDSEEYQRRVVKAQLVAADAATIVDGLRASLALERQETVRLTLELEEVSAASFATQSKAREAAAALRLSEADLHVVTESLKSLQVAHDTLKADHAALKSELEAVKESSAQEIKKAAEEVAEMRALSETAGSTMSSTFSSSLNSPILVQGSRSRRASIAPSRRVSITTRSTGSKASGGVNTVINALEPRVEIGGDWSARPSSETLYADQPSLILFEKPGEEGTPVKAVSPTAAVLWLTNVWVEDPSFSKTFWLTFRTFMSPKEVVEALAARFSAGPRPGEPSAGYEAKRADHVRRKVLSAVNQWIDSSTADFSGDSEAVSCVLGLLSDRGPLGASAAAGGVPAVAAQMKRKLAGALASGLGAGRRVIEPEGGVPKPVIPRAKSPGLLDIAPEELARQIAVVDSQLFGAIRPRELATAAWTKANKAEVAPTVYAVIQRTNFIGTWVASEILKPSRTKARTAVVEHWLKVLSALWSMGDFSGLWGISAGLQNVGVYRLKSTWAGLNKSSRDIWTRASELTSTTGNYSAYKAALAHQPRPVIPFIGTFLTELVGVMETAPSKTPEGLVSWRRASKVASVIQERFLSFQAETYCWEAVPVVMRYMNSAPMDDDTTLYRRSLTLEPRS